MSDRKSRVGDLSRSCIEEAVVNALFPHEPTRRAFLTAVGSNTAMAAIASVMPLAMSIGLGSAALPTSVATIQNNNGQAITLHIKHKNRRNPRQWKGFTFAVPFTYSMHNFLLRYYLAEHGLDPDTGVKIINV